MCSCDLSSQNSSCPTRTGLFRALKCKSPFQEELREGTPVVRLELQGLHELNQEEHELVVREQADPLHGVESHDFVRDVGVQQREGLGRTQWRPNLLLSQPAASCGPP